LILNPRAGRGGQTAVIRAVSERLRENGHSTAEFECLDSSAEPAASALKDGCDVLVACGGDGTVNGVASAVLGSRAALGVLPLGTLNHFARDLGISSLAVAEHALIRGNERMVDVASLNGQIFVNNSGIGIYPVIVLERDAIRKSGIPRWPAFVWACLKAIAKPPLARLRLEADETHLARVTPFLFVGNNVYRTEGLAVGTREWLDSGVLGICTGRHRGRLGIVRLAFRSVVGTIRQDRDFTVLTARRLVVRTAARHVRVSLDGELGRMRPPLQYEILPGALKVIAP
jgi:diacylglycerol kinase family enzyme